MNSNTCQTRWIFCAGLILFGLGFSASAEAAGVTWNGFASVHGRYTPTDVADSGNIPHELNFAQDIRLGLNLRSDLSEKWAAVAQMVTSGDRSTAPNANPNWTPHFDWAFLSYTPTSNVNIKAGRQLLPSWLVAEYIDVGVTYPWRRPPPQLYDMIPFKSFDGASASYQYQWGSQSLTARLFGGASHYTLRNDETALINAKELVGVSLNLDGDGWHLQAVTFRANVEFKVNTGYYVGSAAAQSFPISPLNPVVSQPLAVDLFADGAQAITLGASYDRGGLVAYAEYGQVTASNGTNNSYTYGTSFLNSNRGAYGTLGYHLGSWMPHYTFAYAKWDSGIYPGTETSHGLGLNYQIDPSVVLKAEYLRQEAVNGPVRLSALVAGIAQSVALGVDVVF